MPLTRWPETSRWASGGDDLNNEQMMRRVHQAMSCGVNPALQSPVPRFSYPQLRASARYRPLPNELMDLFAYSEDNVCNDDGLLDDDHYLQIARQLFASSINRSRSPSPMREHLLRHVPYAFSDLSGSQPAARTQFDQQASGNTFAASDSALLAMRTPAPTTAASTAPQTETISEKAALELLDATLRESEQQLRRDEFEPNVSARHSRQSTG